MGREGELGAEQWVDGAEITKAQQALQYTCMGGNGVWTITASEWGGRWNSKSLKAYPLSKHTEMSGSCM